MRSPLALKRTALSASALTSASRPLPLRSAAQRIVVMHHGLAVGAQLQIAFDAVIGCNGRGESAGGIARRSRPVRLAIGAAGLLVLAAVVVVGLVLYGVL